MGCGNSATLNRLWERDDGRRKWLGCDVRIRNGHLIDASRNDRHPHYTIEGRLKGRAEGSGANGRIWPAMMSAELPEGWA